jgi:hypothetical protein
MAVIVVHVGKNMVDDVLLDGGSRVNAIIDGLRQKLRLPPPPPPFNLWMANFSFNKPLGIVPNIMIRILTPSVNAPSHKMFVVSRCKS